MNKPTGFALASILMLASCDSRPPAPAVSKIAPRGISAATAVFEKHHVTIAIPMDAVTWGSAVELDEAAGFQARLDVEKAFAEGRRVPEVQGPKLGAFGLIMKLEEPEPQSIDFIIWPQDILDSDEYLLLECFVEPQHYLYGQPRTWRARLLQDQVRRARLGNIAIGTAADQETVLIHDSAILFEHFIEHRPRQIDVYVTIKGKGVQKASIPVEYRVDPTEAQPAPSL